MTTTTVVAQPKWLGRSTTIWGALIALAATAYQVVGPIADAVGVTVPVTPEDIAAASHAGSAILSGVGAAVGLALTIWGRFKAGRIAQPISVVPGAPPVSIEVIKSGTSGKTSG